jgi:hypothetical protein
MKAKPMRQMEGNASFLRRIHALRDGSDEYGEQILSWMARFAAETRHLPFRAPLRKRAGGFSIPNRIVQIF